MGISAYFLRTGDDDKYDYGGLLEPGIAEQDWFSIDVMATRVFEDAVHNLAVLDREEHDVSSDHLHDVECVDSGVLALSQQAWPLLPALINSGCRIAENVNVSGGKRFKLVYPARVLDILDHDASELHINEAAGAVSHVRNRTLYDEPPELPMMFQVLFRGPKKSGPSMDIFVSQDFVDAYNHLGLTGADFHLLSRSKRAG